eukprot:CAMPEP_0168608460 /NCGR_PEP_ID=MMETSP0449_2-20121227/640_1 /TAXON_ID=1082188 /ORGANISM="Strombidium rassoulzadegani, Strain ras09" /LENGTH=61 /DNA_ID=CAMNT_0008648449 /DNA_START=398 /DNA_END=583 /DNA_ORIENTATION=-
MMAGYLIENTENKLNLAKHGVKTGMDYDAYLKAYIEIKLNLELKMQNGELPTSFPNSQAYN